MSNHDDRSQFVLKAGGISISKLALPVRFKNLGICFDVVERIFNTYVDFSQQLFFFLTARPNLSYCSQGPTTRFIFCRWHTKSPYSSICKEISFSYVFVDFFIYFFILLLSFFFSAEHSCLGPAMQKGPIWLCL